MKIQELEALVAEAVHDADLRPEEIPSIDLYLDQITSLVTDKRKEGSELFLDRALTKTMINNYSKDGLLSPIKGKKYSKEHILQMLLVYELKNTLSIGEIKRVLRNLYRMPSYSPQLLEQLYLRVLEDKEYDRQKTRAFVSDVIADETLDAENEEDFFSLIVTLAAMSSYLKNTVQLLLEAHYPDLDAEKTREEQEKREEEKRAEAEKKEEAKRQKAELEAEKRAAKEEKEAKKREARDKANKDNKEKDSNKTEVANDKESDAE